jgi:sigma-B regulation protein RsbU (phosphoserine phosphatase)
MNDRDLIIKEENLMEEVIENMEYMVRVMDQKDNVIYMNRKMRGEFGDHTAQKCFELLGGEGKCLDCICTDCQKSGKAESKDIRYGERFFKVIASPVETRNNNKYAIELFHDVTIQRVLQEEILQQYDKMKSDIEFAKNIQDRVLPINDVYWNSIILDSAYLPSEDLGGDMFDLIKVDDDNILLYMADVSGHGIKSSLLTMFLHQAIRGMKKDVLDTDKMLNELIGAYQELKMSEETYVSIIFGIYNISKREIRFINAGHNCLPLIIGKSGEIREIKVSGMPICSLLMQAAHETVVVQVEKGDKVIFYTDGITEVYNDTTGEFFGDTRFYSIIRENSLESGKEVLRKVIEGIKDFSNRSLSDDIAIFSAEIC